MVGHVLAAIPIFHLLATSVFASFYCFGFGGGIRRLITVSDVIQFSFTDMAPIYIVALGLQAVIRIPVGDYLDRLQGGRPKSREDTKRFVLVKGGALVLGICLLTFTIVYIGIPKTVLIVGICTALITVSLSIAISPYGLSKRLIRGIEILFSFVTMSAAMGFNTGYYEARDPLGWVGPHCNGVTILRRMGGGFIAASKGGQVFYINPECKPQMTIDVGGVNRVKALKF